MKFTDARFVAESTQQSRKVRSHATLLWSNASTHVDHLTSTQCSEDRASAISPLQHSHLNWGLAYMLEVFQRLDFIQGTHWEFDPDQVHQSNCGFVTPSLILQSSGKIRDIPFEEWVEYSRDRSLLKLMHFLGDYKSLHGQICRFYMKRPDRLEDLHQIKKDMEAETARADPFLRTTVQHAYDCVAHKNTKRLDLIAPLRRFITDPLKQALHNTVPSQTVLQRMKILRPRLGRYLSGCEDIWDKPFNTSTAFLEDFPLFGPLALATSITQVDYDLYRKLDVNSFLKNTADLQTLKQRENDLLFTVKDCLDTELLPEDELLMLAEHFYDTGNYFSMNAVSEGIKLAQSSPETKQRLHNLNQQLSMDKPGLYPLRLASRDVARGSTERARMYINLCVRFTPEASSSFPTGTRAIMLKITKATDSVIDEKEVRSNIIHSAPLIGENVLENPLKQVTMEYRLASTENSVNNRGILDYSSVRRFQLPVWLHCFGTQ